MEEVCISGKSCKMIENTIKSPKCVPSHNAFTLSKAIQWAECAESAGPILVPGPYF